MSEPKKYTMATTTDADIHLFEGNLVAVRQKVDYAQKQGWPVSTVDGRLVYARQIVSLWTPRPEEVSGWLSSGDAGV